MALDELRAPGAATKRLERPESRTEPTLKRRAGGGIEERDRVFAFLFGIPLELSTRLPGWPFITAILFWSMVGLSLLSWIDPSLGVRLALQVEEPGLLTVLQLGTSILVHADVGHLLGNVYFLVAFGRLPEVQMGSGRFAALFFASAGVGSVYYLLRHFGEEMVVLGASGGIAGILGAYAVMFPSHRVGLSLLVRVVPIPALFYFLGWAYLQFLLADTEAESGVGYAAHLLGFAVGVVWGVVERRRPGFAEAPARGGS